MLDNNIYIEGEPSLSMRDGVGEGTMSKEWTDIKAMNIAPVSISSVYPNPIYENDLNIDIISSSNLNNVNLKIYDISGRLVKRIECLSSDINSVNINDNTSEKEIQLDLKALNDGIYILSVDKEVYKNILICK